MAEKWGVDLQDLLPRFTSNDATADVLWSYDYEKRGRCNSCWRSYFGRPSVKLRGPLGTFSPGIGPPKHDFSFIFIFIFECEVKAPSQNIVDQIRWVFSFWQGVGWHRFYICPPTSKLWRRLWHQGSQSPSAVCFRARIKCSAELCRTLLIPQNTSAVCFAEQIDWPVLLCPADHASQLMEKAFDVAIDTNLSTASYISDAMALLSMQTGAWWAPPPVSSHGLSCNFRRVKYNADDETSVPSRTPRFLCLFSVIAIRYEMFSPTLLPIQSIEAPVFSWHGPFAINTFCADVVVCSARHEHTGITSSLYYTANAITTSSTNDQLQLPNPHTFWSFITSGHRGLVRPTTKIYGNLQTSDYN